MNCNRKGSVAAIVVGVVALIVVAGVAWYFISDPFHTRVKASFDQMTKWTPENIAAHPEDYLTFVEQKTTEALQQLKADRISVAINRGKLQEMNKEAASKVQKGEQTVQQLVELYKQGSAGATFTPVAYDGTERNEDWFKNNIVSLASQIKTQKTIAMKTDAGIKKLDAQQSKINKAEGDATAQLTEITANKELLKVQKLTDDLKDRLVTMKAAVQGVIDTAGDTGSTISLDQLARDSETKVDNQEFNKLLTEYKK